MHACQDTQCDTHDLLSGRELPIDQQWRNCANDVEDPALKAAIHSGIVTFVQRKVQAFENEDSIEKLLCIKSKK